MVGSMTKMGPIPSSHPNYTDYGGADVHVLSHHPIDGPER
jgi:hypothetical protein